MLATPLKSTDVRLRVEPEIKDSASKVLAECGLTISEGIRLFLRQVSIEKGLPFEVKVPNSTTKAAMLEARAIGKGRFANADELMRDLEKAR